jgi:hypothetical protein
MKSIVCGRNAGRQISVDYRHSGAKSGGRGLQKKTVYTDSIARQKKFRRLQFRFLTTTGLLATLTPN